MRFRKDERLIICTSILLICCLWIVGCGSKETNSIPTISLAATKKSTPWLGYEGPGRLQYTTNLSRFNFTASSLSGTAWLTVKGQLQWDGNPDKHTRGDSAKLTIHIESESDREFKLKLLGFSAAHDEPGEGFEEVIAFPIGKTNVDLERYCRFTYEYEN